MRALSNSSGGWRRRAVILCLCTFLAGCPGLHDRHAGEPEWRFKGKLGYRTPGGSGSVLIDWRQYPRERFDVVLRAALGVALALWYRYLVNERTVPAGNDAMQAALLGPQFSGDEIASFVQEQGAVAHRMEDDDLPKRVAAVLAEGKVVGWFQGRMEFGPRALGNRSILGDPRSENMQKILNLKIKYRESFRPFAPAIISEDCSQYFDLTEDSPYMLIVTDVLKDRIVKNGSINKNLSVTDRINLKRSDIPAVTHVDYSARVQTVTKNSNEKFYTLIKEFKKITGCSLLVNTSFNVRDEPIVCSPEDAYKCFMGTEMDALAIGNFLLRKINQ